MRTKLSVFCDRLLEAGWLLALIVAPLFFNVYSSRVFEPDKLSIVRSIALIMIVAWLVKLLDGGAWGMRRRPARKEPDEGKAPPTLWERFTGVPLLLPTVLLVVVYLLSSLLSVAPRISLWGSYMRLQGTYTTFSYIVIFLLMLNTMRRQEQVDRLCNTVILTSLPISLYGILQHYNLDSLPWSGDVTFRVAANMGNSIFVAAYMIMAVPLTLARLIDSFSVLLKETEGAVSHALLAGAYTFVLSIQAICIFFTQSRGPWMGLLGGLYVFVLIALVSMRRSLSDQSRLTSTDLARAIGFALASIPVAILPAYVVAVAMRRGRRWLWLSWIVHTLLIVAFLVTLNLPNTPLTALREMPYVGRLGQVFELGAGTGRVRVLIWEGALELISANPLRALVGYGPETMHVAYNPYYPPDLAHYEARNASPDRSHNETFDALVITGVVGFVVYMFLFGSLVYFGLKWLGFMETERQRNLFLGLAIAGSVAGVFLPRLVEGTFRLSGVGLPIGFIAGASLYLMLSAAFFYYTSEQPDLSSKRRLLLIGLFSAIVAHFVEIHFGIAIASTRVHFWAYTAVFVLLGLNWIQEQSPEEAAQPAAAEIQPRERSRSKRARRRAKRRARRAAAPATASRSPASSALTRRLLAGSLVMAIILFTLGFEFIANPTGEIDSLRIIQLSLTTMIARGDPRRSFGALWMLTLTWLVGALIVLSGTESSAPRRQELGWWLRALGIYSAVTLTVFVFGMAAHTSLIKPGADIANTISFYYVALAVMGTVLAAILLLGTDLPQRLMRVANVWAYPILAIVAVVLIFATNVSTVKADIYYKQGLKLEESQLWDRAIQRYDMAISLAPDQDYYYLFLGRALMSQAGAAPSSEERVRGFEQSLEALHQARQLNPLNTDHYANLGRLHRNWADVASSAEERVEKLQQADAYYAQAAERSPNNAQIYNEWALTRMAMGDDDTALEKLDRSLELDQEFASTYLILGNLYGAQRQLDEAAEAYGQALELEPNNAEAHSALGFIFYEQGNITDALAANLKAVELKPDLARAHSTLGLIYFHAGRLEEAIEENLKVLEFFPNDFISHRNLALLYQQLDQPAEALPHARAALDLAPEADLTAMQQLIEQLEAQAAAG
jgi:tetratricopeptide (TPR) repeat protein/O-antigen ligase